MGLFEEYGSDWTKEMVLFRLNKSSGPLGLRKDVESAEEKHGQGLKFCQSFVRRDKESKQGKDLAVYRICFMT